MKLVSLALGGLALTTLTLGTPMSVQAQKEAPTPIRKKVARPSDPESAALILDLMTRYARGVAEPQKTDLDKRLERSLSRSPQAKTSVQRILARLSALPAERRQALLGARSLTSLGAPVSRVQLKSRLPKSFVRPLLKPKQDDDDQAISLRLSPEPLGFQVASLTPVAQPNVTLSYRALRCSKQSNDGPALPGTKNLDEPYIIFNIISTVGEDATLESSKKHPGSNETYTNVASRTTVGRTLNLYVGPPKPLLVQVIVVENDFGDPEQFREDSETLARAVVDSVADSGGKAEQKFSDAEKIAMDWATRLLTDLFMSLFGDDVIADEYIDLTPEELRGMASQPLKTSGAAELQGRKVQYSFTTRHAGEDGSLYRGYFQVR